MRRAPIQWQALHWPLVLVTSLIGVLGVYNLHSSAAMRQPDLYLIQLAVLGLSLGVIAVTLLVDYRVSESLAYPFYVVAALLLVAVLLEGKVARGATRWLALGPIVFQPSEFAKLATILCLARYFGHRAEPDGYSMRSLFRPLNPSRPVAVIAVLALFWRKPWLADPVGFLARAVSAKLGGTAPAPGNLVWFRALLIVALAAVAVAGAYAIAWYARQQSLLDPWAPGRRRRTTVLWLTLCAALGAALAANWTSPVLRDPLGVAMAALVGAAGPAGPYHAFTPGLTLRLALSLAALIYLGASLWHARASGQSLVDLLIAPVDLLAVPALLILAEPDLGTAGILFLIGFTMILAAGVRLQTLVIMGVMGAVVAVIGWFGILEDYQKRRVLTFLDPEHDIKGAGWNAVQSIIAVGSGRWFGKGHMGGTQSQLSFLPEQHTDFAFSVWAEEQGFFGALVLLALILALLVFAFNVASQAREPFGGLVATGVAALILWQAVINVGMVIGMVPVVGVTLPLFSYGGSSLLTTMVGVALLLNVHLRRRAH